MPEDQELLPPDFDRISRQRDVVEGAVRARYGSALSGSEADLGVLQRLVDENVFRVDQTYELQSLGIVLGEVFSAHTDLSWVTVRDEYGVDPALRYKETSLLVFPLTMISKRLEEGREVEVRALYEAVLASLPGLEAEGY